MTTVPDKGMSREYITHSEGCYSDDVQNSVFPKAISLGSVYKFPGW